MAFTRDRIQTILSNETLTLGERVDQIFALHGSTLSGYVSKQDAEKMRDDAVKAVQMPDPKESDAYKDLTKEFEDYKTKQQARVSDDFKTVKGKFFDQVYDAIDHSKPVAAQLENLKKEYAEYFEEEKQEEQKPAGPQFSGNTEGDAPKGGNGTFANYWGWKKD